MKTNRRRKTVYIVISILAAMLLWYYVNSESVVTLHVSKVPVQFVNADTTLADRNLMLVSGMDATVELSLQVPRSIVFKFDTNAITATADLSGITTAGRQQVSYTVNFPSGISTRNITIERPTARFVTVETAEFFSKDVAITCNIVGALAEGCSAGTAEYLPETLQLRGREADLAKVACARVTLDVDGAAASVDESVPFVLCDENGNTVASELIRPVTDRIRVKLPVTTVRDVPLQVALLEADGARGDNFEIEIEPKSIMLSGDAGKLSELPEITLAELALDAIHPGSTFSYPIPVPEEFENLSGVTQAVVRVVSSDLQTEPFNVSAFTYRNFKSDHATVEIVTSSLEVVLRGTADALATVKPSELEIVANLLNVSDAGGVYTVPAEVQYTGNADVGAVGTYQVVVRLDTGNTAE